MDREHMIELARKNLNKAEPDHEIWNTALVEMQSKFDFGALSRLILLVGPAGVGTKSVAMALKRQLGHLAVTVSASYPARGQFDWRSFWWDGCDAIKVPCIGQRRRATESENGQTDFLGSAAFRGESDLRRDFSNGLRQRGVRHLIIINSENFLARTSSDEAAQKLKILQSLLQDCQPVTKSIILAGTYENLNMCRKDPGLDFDVSIVAMRPYTDQEMADAIKFASILRTYENLLSEICPQDLLVSHSEEIFKHVLGCPDWIEVTIRSALTLLERSKSKVLTWSHVRRSLPTPGVVKKLQQSIQFGEDWFSEDNTWNDGKRHLTPDGSSEKANTAKRRPGERNADRDQVGA